MFEWDLADGIDAEIAHGTDPRQAEQIVLANLRSSPAFYRQLRHAGRVRDNPTMRDKFKEDLRGARKIAGPIALGDGYSLELYQKPDRIFRTIVVWALRRKRTIGKKLLGTGELVADRTHHRVLGAHILPEARGKGLYTRILHMLRETLQTPITSDVVRTTGADQSWRRAGAQFIEHRDSPFGDGSGYWVL